MSVWSLDIVELSSLEFSSLKCPMRKVSTFMKFILLKTNYKDSQSSEKCTAEGWGPRLGIYLRVSKQVINMSLLKIAGTFWRNNWLEQLKYLGKQKTHIVLFRLFAHKPLYREVSFYLRYIYWYRFEKLWKNWGLEISEEAQRM